MIQISSCQLLSGDCLFKKNKIHRSIVNIIKPFFSKNASHNRCKPTTKDKKDEIRLKQEQNMKDIESLKKEKKTKTKWKRTNKILLLFM